MLIFENKGEIPIEAFYLLGMSAKPNSTNPIGKFGSGLKYAVAVTLRLGGSFTVWSGTTQYDFYTKEMDFRGTTFNAVHMRQRNGLRNPWKDTPMPFTTEFGKEWEPWMAFRELESNTRDEQGQTFCYDASEGVHGTKGMTQIVIDCPEIEEAYGEIHTVFMPSKKLLFKHNSLEVYEGPSDYIFYRGLRVTDLAKSSVFTYNFTNLLGLTEDRTSKFPDYDAGLIRDVFMKADRPLQHRFMNSVGVDNFEASLSFDQASPYDDSFSSFVSVARASKAPLPRVAALVTSYDEVRVEAQDTWDTEVTIEMTARDWMAIIDLLPEDQTQQGLLELVEEQIDITKLGEPT